MNLQCADETEGMLMEQVPSPSRSFAEHPVAKTVGHTVPLIRAAVLAVSVAAAVPTAHNLYYSWTNGIPYAQVPHRLAQYDLWMKNFDCKIDYRQISTQSGTKVDAGACAKSGDIAIKISGASGLSAYEWIAFNDLQKPSKVSLLDLLIPPAEASETPAAPASASAAPAAAMAPSASTLPGAFKTAQAGMQVMCQEKGKGDRLIRIVQEAGKCYRETVSMMKGALEKREEVPCTTTCK